MINALEQMAASPGRELYLLSIQFAPAIGETVWSLKSTVTGIREILEPPRQFEIELLECLEALFRSSGRRRLGRGHPHFWRDRGWLVARDRRDRRNDR